MHKVNIEKLTYQNFAEFGTFYQFYKPDGYALTGEIHSFFPDRFVESFNGRVGFSPITVRRPREMIIKTIEYHTRTPEIIMPLNDDMILHVAPPSAGKPVTDRTRAYLVPRHTVIKINAGVWHLAPLPSEREELTAMIILPECTYINDIRVVDLPEEECFIINKV
ncbi:MAG: ureidoglycolate lyase [Lachnospiraceae bacterium]